MKKTITVLLTFLSLSYSNAQSLRTRLNSIAASNDMMGGSLVVFCKNGITENISIGKSDFTRNIDVTTDTKYRIASISKAITAIAVMQLVERNLLDLDADISTILGYSVVNPNHPTVAITPRMLLSHTSSIIDGTTYSSFMNATVNDNPIPNVSEILTVGGSYYTSGQFNNSVPGTYFNYSNINYVILGTIVEKVTNTRFDIYCKQNISIPLGIDASFNVNDLTDINQLAVIYRKSGGVWNPQVDDYQGVQPVFGNLSGYIPGTNGGRFGPQGGFRCSGKDLAKIFLVLMNKGSYNGHTLLSEASCNAMFANRWTYNGSNGNNYYGLFRSWGLGIHRITSTPRNDVVLSGSSSMLGHAGEAYGLVSSAYFDTTRRVGFVFITNGVGVGYQTNSNSSFYTIEQDVFKAIENYGNILSCTQTVGLNESLREVSWVYPNPTNGLFQVDIPNQYLLSIKVYNSLGQLIKETSEKQINLANHPSGAYIVEVRTQEGNYFYKLIKQ
jgi:CubicO group peptidase (beta-lactamase class C family)